MGLAFADEIDRIIAALWWPGGIARRSDAVEFIRGGRSGN
jgi:hypothetical protein